MMKGTSNIFKVINSKIIVIKWIMIEPLTNRFSVETNEVLWARTYFLTLGFISMAGLINFDINVINKFLI